MDDDPRDAAARYRIDKELREQGLLDDDPATRAEEGPPRHPTARDRAAYVENAIQQAIRRGDFDDLPGYGKPLQGLGDRHDPDWWIRRKIESEQLTGLGPPALALRVESAELEQRLDEFAREDDVRAHLDDFNLRVVEARRQLLGGPPVVTPTRDVAAEVEAWRERRRLRAEAAAAAAAASDEPKRRRSRRSRRG